MRTSFIFMGVTWAAIIGLFVYSVARTLRGKDAGDSAPDGSKGTKP